MFQRLKHHFKNADNVIDASVDVVEPKKEPKAHYDERQGWTIQEK